MKEFICANNNKDTEKERKIINIGLMGMCEKE